MKGSGALAVTFALCVVTSPAVAGGVPDVGDAQRSASKSGSPYTFFVGGKRPGAYWDPCRVIRYGIDFTYASRIGLRRSWEIKRWRSSVAEFARASGLRFRYVGAVRTRSNGAEPGGGPPIAITYGSEAAKGRYGYRRVIRGAVAGVGGVRWIERGPKPHEIVRGYVVIDAKAVRSRARRFDPRPARQRPVDQIRALYMHEFGHALGLDHTLDRNQLMHATLRPDRPDALGDGDLEGLRLLGEQPCH